MTEENIVQQEAPQVQLPPYKVAFVLDNEVVDVLHTDERLAAIFLSNPKIIDVTDKVTADPSKVQIGFLYNEELNSFINPEVSNSNGESNV